MSGHSKWHNIKRTKEKVDAANAKVFTKLLREISVAVKEGGPDPNSNNRLKNAILKARYNNMPNDTIQRNIKKASGELGQINFDNMTYEGYGPAGSAVIVTALTDNKNRTAGELRHYFDKFGGSLGQTGSVSYMFKLQGEIIIIKDASLNDDDVMLNAIEAGADDVIIEEDYYKIITHPNNYDTVKNNLEKQGLKIEDGDVVYSPTNLIELNGDKLIAFSKLIDALEDNDDVQDVYHNVNLPEIADEE